MKRFIVLAIVVLVMGLSLLAIQCAPGSKAPLQGLQGDATEKLKLPAKGLQSTTEKLKLPAKGLEGTDKQSKMTLKGFCKSDLTLSVKNKGGLIS